MLLNGLGKRRGGEEGRGCRRARNAWMEKGWTQLVWWGQQHQWLMGEDGWITHTWNECTRTKPSRADESARSLNEPLRYWNSLLNDGLSISSQCQWIKAALLTTLPWGINWTRNNTWLLSITFWLLRTEITPIEISPRKKYMDYGKTERALATLKIDSLCVPWHGVN